MKLRRLFTELTPVKYSANSVTFLMENELIVIPLNVLVIPALLLGFRCNSSISTIDFTDCDISDKGALHIACLLQVSRSEDTPGNRPFKFNQESEILLPDFPTRSSMV